MKITFPQLITLSVAGFLSGCGASNSNDLPTPPPKLVIQPLESKNSFIIGNGLRITIDSNWKLLVQVPLKYDPEGEEKIQFGNVEISPAAFASELPAFKGFIKRNPIKERSYTLATTQGEATLTWQKDDLFQLTFDIENVNIPPKTSIGNWTYEGIQSINGKNQAVFTIKVDTLAEPVTSPITNRPVQVKFANSPESSELVTRLIEDLRLTTVRNILPVRKFGMAPFGISNDLYFGHTFWDADVWMLPALLFTEPQAARDIVDYRLSLVEQARKNAAITLKQPSKALQFPWESSVSGKETVPGESKKEHHITGSVLWGMTQAEAVGLVPSATVKPIAQGAATFYQLRSKKTNRGREILDVMSPDENFIGDNDLYTNLLAQWLTNDRNWEGPTKFYLPKDDKSHLTYEHDPLRSYKQAAAVLAIYPLEFPEAEKNARAMMNRFESKVIKNGPAMTESVHSIIWSRLGETDKALNAWKKSYEPFLVKGSNEFSEKRSTVRAYFYTGSAGVINSVIYGFAGIRLDKKPQQRATFRKQLKSGWYLSVTPHIPAELGDLQLTNLVIDGKTTSLKCTVDGKVTFQPPI